MRKKIKPPCRWIENDDGAWKTACGEIFAFGTGTPAENKAAFCLYCGATLKQVVYPLDETGYDPR